MYQTIIIKKVKTLDKATAEAVSTNDGLFGAYLYILKNSTHFMPIKNRFDAVGENECIPNFLLRSYLDRFLNAYKDNYILNLLDENK